MKKLFSVFLLIISFFTTQCVFVSCEKDDGEGYYAGESEADYKPAEYTITSEWDLSKVSGLSDAEKQLYKAQLEDAAQSTAVYNTRTDAIKAFDIIVENLRTDADINMPGLSAKIYLKRKSAIIKSATLTW